SVQEANSSPSAARNLDALRHAKTKNLRSDADWVSGGSSYARALSRLGRKAHIGPDDRASFVKAPWLRELGTKTPTGNALIMPRDGARIVGRKLIASQHGRRRQPANFARHDMLTNATLTAFVASADPARSRSFYRDTLGLHLVSDDQFAVVFD